MSENRYGRVASSQLPNQTNVVGYVIHWRKPFSWTTTSLTTTQHHSVNKNSSEKFCSHHFKHSDWQSQNFQPIRVLQYERSIILS